VNEVWQTIQLVSLLATICASAVLLTDAEAMGNTDARTRKRYFYYFGYLPLRNDEPVRHWKLVILMTLFLGSYLVMGASSAAAASRQFPRTVVAILGGDCALYHVWKAYDGDWWMFGKKMKPRAVGFTMDLIFNTIFWLIAHGCPPPTARDPNWIGPHHAFRTVMLSFVEASVFSWLARDNVLVWRWCLPAEGIALAALIAFIFILEDRFRLTFYKSDSKREMSKRMFEGFEGTAEQIDFSRATLLAFRGDSLQEGHADGVLSWIAERGPAWRVARPEWLTAQLLEKIPTAFSTAIAPFFTNAPDAAALSC